MAQKSQSGLLWGILILLAALGVIYFTTQNPAPTEKVIEEGPIKIGVIASLTGEQAPLGLEMQRAYDLAVEEVNGPGGEAGRQIELVYEDGKCAGTDATTAAQKLINIDKVNVILGGTCSGETLAVAGITQAARVLLISPSATSPDITSAGDLVFRTYPSSDFEASVMAKYADEELGVDRAAIISENTGFAQGVRKAFVSSWIDREHNIVFDEAFDTGNTDFSALVAKIKSAKSEVVYVIPNSTVAGELILKQLQKSRVPARVFIAGSMFDRAAFAQNRSLYENAVFAELVLDQDNEMTSEMLRAYSEKYGGEPEFGAFAAAAYDSVYLIAQAMRAGNMDAESIARYFNESVSDWPGAIGTFNFDENGDALIKFSLLKVEDGEGVAFER